ncbi:MAG: amidophosphoribosyltransferase [Euryarchaeota archaeon]|nr:amidophosphoribosyltransferase [Euryarchaeota archaeon]
MREKCGVVGIYTKSEKGVSSSIFYALYALQHRGQESCGITTYDGEFHTEKGMGLVPEFFNLKKLENLKGNMGIGHVRYSTTGESKPENAHPFVVTHSRGTLAIGHNGNIVNALELRTKLETSGQAFVMPATDTDTELIARLIVGEFVSSENIVASITEVMKRLIGSYSLVMLTDNELIAVRDPLGIRPLCLGKSDDATIVASESVVFDVLNVHFLRDVKPGEILVINEKGSKSYRPFKLNRSAHCMFEYVYFARPDSVIDGIPVYKVREKIGTLHGESDDVEADFVSPVPDSAIPFALGYARAAGIPYRESLIKNRYVGRTFILPDQQARELAVRLKLNPMVSEVKGEKIVLFDDSVVRGTTSGRIIRILKDAGAKEVHMRVGCPPIKSLCKLGIDMPTDRELVASDKSVEMIRRHIGADSLKYLSIEDLMKAIGLGENELCLGCLTGKYPVEIAKHEQVLLPSFIKT